MNDSSYVFEIIYRAMQNSGNTLSDISLCSITGVSCSGYYAWIMASPIWEQQEQQDRQNFELIPISYKMHGYSKSAWGINMTLLPVV